jgi:hypothetical protein
MRKKPISFLSLNSYLIVIFLSFFTQHISAAPPQPPDIDIVNVEFASGSDYICTEFNNGNACWKLHIEGLDLAAVTEGIVDDDWNLVIGCKPTIAKSSCKLNTHEGSNTGKHLSSIDCLIDTVPIGHCETTVSTSKGSSTFLCNFKPTPSGFDTKVLEGRLWQCTKEY